MLKGQMRRRDRAMSPDEAWESLEHAFCGRVGTSDDEGWPYVVPQLFVVSNSQIYFHNSASRSHMRSNILSNPKVCFETDEPGYIFPYGEEAQCETSVSFESVIAFGTAVIIHDRDEKIAFFKRFMAKYADPRWERPIEWPMIDQTSVYAMSIEKITGKRRPVVIPDKWQSLFSEHTKASPNQTSTRVKKRGVH